VVAPGRQTSWDAASHLDNGNFMTLGAGGNAGHSWSTVSVDPARRMVVPVVLGRSRSPLAAATNENQ
jgi:hypothetical protein